MPVTGVVGKITEYGDPPSVSNGQVVSQTWLANITATVNGAGFTQIPRAFLVPAAACSTPWTTVGGGGTVGGFTLAGGTFYVVAANASNILVVPIMLPFQTGASGSAATLTGVAVRIKPAGALAMTAKIWGINHQNDTTGPSTTPLSNLISSSGTAEQTLTVPMLTPAVVDATTLYVVQVSAAQVNDLVYSTQVQYTVAGY